LDTGTETKVIGQRMLVKEANDGFSGAL